MDFKKEPVRIINFPENEPVFVNGFVEFENGKIARIREARAVPRYFVTPGFINTHGHWLMLGGTSLGEVVNLIENNPSRMLEMAIENAQKTLRCGITTVCDKGPPGRKNAPQLLQEIKKKRDEGAPVPRTFASHWTLSAPGGFADVFLQAVSTKDELLQKMEELRASGSELVKFILETDSDENGNYRVVVSDEILGAAMDFANRHGMRVCAHAKGALGVDAAIRHGLASVEHALQASDANLSLMEERNVFIALTLEGFECRYRHAKEHHERTDIVLNAEREWNLAQNLARRLAHFHGESLSANNVLFGSDAGSHSTPHASLRELALMRRMGFSATDIFRSATWNGARFLNQSHVMGKIDGGYAADFIVWQKNPLEFSNAEWENLESHMVAVVVGGVVVGTDFSV